MREQEARAAIVDHYDERATAYDESSMHRALAEEVAGLCAGLTPGTVVDVGTGTGLVLRALAHRAPRTGLVGVDISLAMLAVARAATPGVHVACADAAALPLASGSVDVVTCVTALHLLPHPARAYAEWARVLRPGGRLVTATFGASAAKPRPQAFPKRHDAHRRPEQVAAAAAPHGFALLRHHEWHHGHDDTRDHLLICELGLSRSA